MTDLPVITPEQRKRFETEYRELREQADAATATAFPGPQGNGPRNLGPHDYTEGENVWCLARAYSEQLQLKSYPCQKCGADTGTVETPGDLSLRCPKCGWDAAEVQVLAPVPAVHTPHPAQGGSIQQPGGYYGGTDY